MPPKVSRPVIILQKIHGARLFDAMVSASAALRGLRVALWRYPPTTRLLSLCHGAVIPAELLLPANEPDRRSSARLELTRAETSERLQPARIGEDTRHDFTEEAVAFSELNAMRPLITEQLHTFSDHTGGRINSGYWVEGIEIDRWRIGGCLDRAPDVRDRAFPRLPVTRSRTYAEDAQANCVP